MSITEATLGTWELVYDEDVNAIRILINNRYLMFVTHENVDGIVASLDAGEQLLVEALVIQEQTEDNTTPEKNPLCLSTAPQSLSEGSTLLSLNFHAQDNLMLLNDLMRQEVINYVMY